MVSTALGANLLLNEVLLNPPGADSPNEYIELRGTPGLTVPTGTCLVTIEGDAEANPGTIQNVFNLSGCKVGANGFLVLLQKATPYVPDSHAVAIINTNSGSGWGNGLTSSIGHTGNGGLLDLKNASVTYLLIHSTNVPSPGADIDPDNDGTPDGPLFAGWTLLDSVGVLDADGAGDIVYGAVNFRRNTPPGNAASASGVIIPIGFTPAYVARGGNTTGSTPTDWVAGSSLAGSAPNWSLANSQNTYPVSMAGQPLNHLGAVNFEVPPRILLSEIKVNPPGTNDAPNEFIELRGDARASLTNVSILAIDGNVSLNPGRVGWTACFSNVNLGANGLLIVAATNHAYAVSSNTTIVLDPLLSQPGSSLGNGTIAFLLIRSATSVQPGADLDAGDNGVLEGLPADAVILDSVGWSDGDNRDIVYGGAQLRLPRGTPDAATRLSWDDTPISPPAWICGDLAGPDGATLQYDSSLVSTNFPLGTRLSPGQPNNIAPIALGAAPMSGVIGDPYNPVVSFSVNDDQTPAAEVLVSATSSNPLVVPNTNLLVTIGAGGARTLSLNPIGVGYADITLWLSEGSQTGAVTFPYAASAPGREGGVWHLAASDASTAIPVDADYMIAGDDENQTLRLYERHRSGLPIRLFDMTQYLALPDEESGVPREVDVEASTRIGNRLFWIGSLGHAANGENRTNRTRLFATDLSGLGFSAQLTYAGRYDFLKVDLIAWDMQNLHGKGSNYFGLEASDADGVPPKAPDGSGLAVEGLSAIPGSSQGAYIAFRAPIVPPTNRTHALVVPLLNMAALVSGSHPPGSAIFGPPIELDLYNRGIRSLESAPAGFLLIGGPPGSGTGPYPQDFRLYSWTGNPSDQPQQRAADLTQLNPEGLVGLPPSPWTPSSQVQLLSDEGATVFYGDGIPAKFLPVVNFKKSRSDLVTLGSIVKPVPIIVSVGVTNDVLSIRWRSLKGEAYKVQYNPDLSPSAWFDLPGDPAIATGPYSTFSLPATNLAAFFRVALVPPE